MQIWLEKMKHKNILLSGIKKGQEILTLGNIEIEKITFYCNKTRDF